MKYRTPILAVILIGACVSANAYQRFCQLLDENKLWNQKAIVQPDYSFEQVVIIYPQTERVTYRCFAKLDPEERTYLVQYLHQFANDFELKDDMLDALDQDDTVPAQAVFQVMKDFLEHEKELGKTVGVLREKLTLPPQDASAAIKLVATPAPSEQTPAAPIVPVSQQTTEQTAEASPASLTPPAAELAPAEQAPQTSTAAAQPEQATAPAPEQTQAEQKSEEKPNIAQTPPATPPPAEPAQPASPAVSNEQSAAAPGSSSSTGSPAPVPSPSPSEPPTPPPASSSPSTGSTGSPAAAPSEQAVAPGPTTASPVATSISSSPVPATITPVPADAPKIQIGTQIPGNQPPAAAIPNIQQTAGITTNP
jgi:hypothetical protein